MKKAPRANWESGDARRSNPTIVPSVVLLLAACIAQSCAAAQAQSWTGKASYYGGRGHMTFAHWSLPFGTHVRVTNLNRSAVLVVDGRGPFIKGRIIDVSVSAADVLGFRHSGLAQVMVETVTD